MSVIEYYVEFDGSAREFHCELVDILVIKHNFQLIKREDQFDYAKFTLLDSMVEVILSDTRLKFRAYAPYITAVIFQIEAYLRTKTHRFVRIPTIICPKCESEKPWSLALDKRMSRDGIDAFTTCDYCDHKFSITKASKF